MKYVEITPEELRGKINIPPSKSISHRGIICGGLAEGVSVIENIVFSDDIRATLEGIKSLGAEVKEIKGLRDSRSIVLKGSSKLKVLNNVIDCNESGSTLRFLIPIFALAGKKVIFTGRGRLIKRPLGPYYEIFHQCNIKYKNKDGGLPLEIEGILKDGKFKIRGDISSQFITGLMFSLPLLPKDSELIITTDLESRGYVDLTIDTLKSFGIEIINEDYKYFYIKGKQKYINRSFRVEGDFSQGAFWLVAGILGTHITSINLNNKSLQGDKAILDILQDMGGRLSCDDNKITTLKSDTVGRVIDVSQCPDLVPILAVLGALSKGTTNIINAKRVRIKESDRLRAITTELRKLGASIEELEDSLIIHGKEELIGGEVDSWKDHRIAMALAIASIKCRNKVIIKNSQVVTKSYPHFWKDFKMLGGKINERYLG